MERINSFCICCYKQTFDKNTDKVEEIEKFIRVFAKYIKTTKSKVYNQFNGLCKEELLLCDDCSTLANTFCQLFFDMECARLQMDWKIRKLYETMNCAGRVRKRLQAFQAQFDTTEEQDAINPTKVYSDIQKLRKGFMKQCKLNQSSSVPRVHLKNCLPHSVAMKTEKLSPQKRNPPVAFAQLANYSSCTKDNLQLLAALVTYIAVLHLSLPLHPTVPPKRCHPTCRARLDLMTERNEENDHEMNTIAKTAEQIVSVVNSDNDQIDICSYGDVQVTIEVDLPPEANLALENDGDSNSQIDVSVESADLNTAAVHQLPTKTGSGTCVSYQCAFCQKRFCSTSTLKTHFLANHRTVQCDLCQINFATMQKLFLHRQKCQMHRKSSLNVQIQRGKFSKAESHPKSPLRMHNNIPSTTSPHMIQVASTSDQDDHQQQGLLTGTSKVGKARPQCPICGMYFGKSFQNTNITQHIQTVHNVEGMDPEKVVSCDLCSAPFTLKRHLTTHLKLVHSRIARKANSKGRKRNAVEYKFLCSETGCGKRFKTRWHLGRHTSSHTNERLFGCDYCTKTFSRRCHMRRHVSRVHGKTVPALQNQKYCKQSANGEEPETPAQPLQKQG